jgi:hypothetical protein
VKLLAKPSQKAPDVKLIQDVDQGGEVMIKRLPSEAAGGSRSCDVFCNDYVL